MCAADFRWPSGISFHVNFAAGVAAAKSARAKSTGGEDLTSADCAAGENGEFSAGEGAGGEFGPEGFW